MPLDQEPNDAPVASEELQTEPVEQTQEPTLAEGETSQAEEAPVEKPNGYQKRIDRLTREKHQLRAELEAVRQRDSVVEDTAAISRDQFSSEDEYLDAVLERRENLREAAKAERSWHEKREQILGDAEDSGVDLDAFSKLPVTRSIADAIVESDAPVDLIAYLTENPKEVKRIVALSPSRQAAEIGKIEATLGGNTSRVAAKTAAPTPIKPLSGSGKSSTGYRADMSQAEYAKWRGRKS
jgi:hypothetical protein